MINLNKCDSRCKDFINLFECLDADLRKRNGDMQDFYGKYNVLPLIETVIVMKDDDIPVGCGCLKKYDNNFVEIKRMYIKSEYRGNGYSKKILENLEKWALELGYTKAVLETGLNQTEALSLYKKCGYHKIDNYGPYIGVANSICFEKTL